MYELPTTYRPDFWVESDNMWFEVKGYMSQSSKDKINLFRQQNNELEIITLNDIEKEHPVKYRKYIKGYRLKN